MKSFTTMADTATKTFNWLNLERAQAIMGIAKRHGAKVKRVAQQRGALGQMKVIVSVNAGSWAASNSIIAKIVTEVRDAGLVNELTFQA
mgnify:CR=1 FL=1